MLCYMDKTFCSAKCKASKCSRMITPEVIAGGTKWWGSADFPIAVSDFSKDCSSYIPNTSEENYDNLQN